MHLFIFADDNFDGLNLEEKSTTLFMDKHMKDTMALMPDKIRVEERPAVSEEKSDDEDLLPRLQFLKEKRYSLQKKKLKKYICKLEQTVSLDKKSKT